VNSATPNFKARDIDFNKALQARMDVGPVNVSNERHFKFYTGSGDEAAQFRQSINPSVDGNTVELHVEQMQFSENVMRYQTSLEFLNRKFSGLMSAIKGE
jgi:flagellar basal-body rod protein FlgB